MSWPNFMAAHLIVCEIYIYIVKMASRRHSKISSSTATHFEVHDLWCHETFKVMVVLKHRLSCYPAATSGTFLREWSCLFLSLFVSHYCLAPPDAHSQWEPRPERSSPSSSPSPFFTTPNPLPLCQNIPGRKAIFASKSDLICCFTGLTLQHC